MIVPAEFTPLELITSKYIARKLVFDDAELDYAAVMSSIELIHNTRGGTWPTNELTLKDDAIDLAWHQREFENKTSFAYTVMNLTQTECLGCFYLYPMGFRTADTGSGHDIDVSWWVTESAYANGLYDQLGLDIQEWLKQWPFKQPYFSNIKLPSGI